MTNPKGQKENIQEVEKVSEFSTAFALLSWDAGLACAQVQLWSWTQILLQQQALPELLLNEQGWMVLAASPGWCGAHGTADLPACRCVLWEFHSD